ncbi:MAG: hypothetical protein KKB50_22295 [Planctomycetes bacterium]|nr:hypothetical protein [Planctomycetota bacterium]
MRMLVSVVAALGLMVATAGADEYWMTYEGNDLPENEGWDRSWGDDQGAFHGDGAYRAADNGILTVDSLYDLRVYDYAYLELPGQVDPDPGEVFVAEWRLLVDETIGVGATDVWEINLSNATTGNIAELRIAGDLGESNNIVADNVTGTVTVGGDLLHDMNITGDITINSPYSDAIFLNDTMAGTVYIDGNMSDRGGAQQSLYINGDR